MKLLFMPFLGLVSTAATFAGSDSMIEVNASVDSRFDSPYAENIFCNEFNNRCDSIRT